MPKSNRYSIEALEKKRLANEKRFLIKVNDKFGSRFDLSKLEYKTQKDYIIIVCPTHGRFESTPDKFTRSPLGCPKCGIELRAKLKAQSACERFLSKFKKKHGVTFKLLSKCEGTTKPIKVECFENGHQFHTVPNRLLYFFKNGCPVCIRRAPNITQNEFINTAKANFPDLDFSKTVYKGVDNKITFACLIHGNQTINANDFRGSPFGCPECGNAQTGYAGYRIRRLQSGGNDVKARPTRIALMRMNIWGIETFKLGVTVRTLEQRYREALVEVYFESVLDELDALLLEQLLHQKYKPDSDKRVKNKGMRDGVRWAGDEELYFQRAVNPLLEELKNHVKELSNRDPEYWKRYPELKIPSAKPRKSEFREGVYNQAKPVICLNDRRIYQSATEAAKSIDTSQGNVSSVCLGIKQKIKGKRFAYLEDYKIGDIPKFIPPRGKKRYVKCIETNKIFDSLTEAGRVTGISSSKITMVCRGKRETAGGYHWEYFDK